MKTDEFALTITDGTGTFYFAGHPIRFILKETEPWFVALDCAKALGIIKARKAVEEFPDDERDDAPIRDAIGRPQKTIVISMPGLLRMIFQSRKTEAEAFKRYVYHEVLPAIQKTGKYEAKPALGNSDALQMPDRPRRTRRITLEEYQHQVRDTKQALERAELQERKSDQQAYADKAAAASARRMHQASCILYEEAMKPYLNKAYLLVKDGGPDRYAKVYYEKAMEMADEEFEPTALAY